MAGESPDKVEREKSLGETTEEGDAVASAGGKKPAKGTKKVVNEGGTVKSEHSPGTNQAGTQNDDHSASDVESGDEARAESPAEPADVGGERSERLKNAVAAWVAGPEDEGQDDDGSSEDRKSLDGSAGSGETKTSQSAAGELPVRPKAPKGRGGRAGGNRGKRPRERGGSADAGDSAVGGARGAGDSNGTTRRTGEVDLESAARRSSKATAAFFSGGKRADEAAVAQSAGQSTDEGGTGAEVTEPGETGTSGESVVDRPTVGIRAAAATSTKPSETASASASTKPALAASTSASETAAEGAVASETAAKSGGAVDQPTTLLRTPAPAASGDDADDGGDGGDGGVEVDADLGREPEAGAEAGAEAAGSEPDAEPDAEPDSEVESKSEPSSGAESEAEPKPESEAKSKPKPKPKPESVSAAKNAKEAEAESGPDAGSGSGSEADPERTRQFTRVEPAEPGAKAESSSVKAGSAEAESAAKADADSAADAGNDSDADSEADADADDESDSERTSKFVALKSADDMPRPLKQPVPAVPPKPLGKPRTDGRGGLGETAEQPRTLTEAELTRQQARPDQAPIDLLAQLTNKPPKPDTPLRTAGRRVKIWTPLVLLVLVLVVVAQAVRPLPGPELTLSAAPTHTFSGTKPAVPWPSEGQAVLDVDGLGSFGSAGKSKPVPVASVAKVMTAYVILRDHPIKKGTSGPSIPVDKKAQDEAGLSAQNESTVDVKKGDKITEREAIQAIMIASANNVARLLARWDAGSEKSFTKKMNAAAKGLRMTNTKYTDPSGLTASTVSTALDQVKLAKRVMSNEVFKKVVAMPSYTDAKGDKHGNWNKLVPLDGVVGIKTGTTSKAGGNLIFAAEKKVGGTKQLIVGAVLGQYKPSILDTVLGASKKLIDTAQDAMRSEKVVHKGQVVGFVDDRLGGRTPVVATRDVTAVGWSGLKVRLGLTGGGKAIPHEAGRGDKVGSLTVGHGPGQVRVPVALKKDMSEPGFGAKLTRIL